jgi:hypothetical protein
VLACVSVKDNCLGVGHGSLMAAKRIVGMSVSRRVNYLGLFFQKGSHASLGVGVETYLIYLLAESTDPSPVFVVSCQSL